MLPGHIPLKSPIVFGLSSLEEFLISILVRQGTSKISELTRVAKRPRTTIVESLKRLHGRGWVRAVRVGKHTEWKLGNLRNLHADTYRFIRSLEERGEPSVETIARVVISPTTELDVYRGVADIIGLYHETIANHARQRVCIIQSTESARQLLQNVAPSKVSALNYDIKKRKLIVDVVVPSSILDLTQKQSSSWKRSMEGRTTSATLVPNELLSFDAEMYIFEDVVLVTNWGEKASIRIKNPDLIAMWRTLYESLQLLGKKFDSNSFLRETLRK